MSSQPDAPVAYVPVGVFGRLGALVTRFPLLVIAAWLALAAGLAVALPSPTEIAKERMPGLLPRDAPTLATAAAMREGFHESGADSLLLVILTDDDGLRPADDAMYRTLVDRLHDRRDDVVMVQDFLANPGLREAFTSKDDRAWYLPVGIAGDLGSPRFREAYPRVAQLVADTVAGSTLHAYLTGPAATVTDLAVVSEHDLHLIDIATGLMVLVILLAIYRNPATMALPLLTIGASLVTARAVVAGLSRYGLGISSQAVILMSAVMLGAGIDYAIFLISRYHDYLRQGADHRAAIGKALTAIGPVIAASAATVAVTFLGMLATRLPVFQTIGPALAISIAVAFAAAVTFLPALLMVAGPRGWVAPRRELTTRFWHRLGVRIVRRPALHFAASLLVLAVLAGCAGLVRYNYDDRATLPAAAGSTIGYQAMAAHFPINSTIPQYLLIQSGQDLRTPQGLADLEQLAHRISQLPDIAAVRGITRPTGAPLEQASLTYQVGEVGGRLGDTSALVTGRSGDLDQLVAGATTLTGSIADIRTQLGQAVPQIRDVVRALTNVQNQFGGTVTFKQLDDAANLISKMHTLGFALGANVANVANTFDWVPPVVAALDTSPVCDADAVCVNSRKQFHWILDARSSGALNALGDLARQLAATPDPQSLQTALDGLRDALDATTRTLNAAGADNLDDIEPRLAALQQGSDALADGTNRLSSGVAGLVEQMKHVGAGLGEASAFLRSMHHDAAQPSMAGFYLPPEALTRDEFRKAANFFVSADGHTVRYAIETRLDIFSTAAMDQVGAIARTAREAQPNTTLADASISMGGLTATLRDTRDYYNRDLRLIVVITVLVVLFVLIGLLRAIVAPLYLIVSVLVSYLAALGISVLVFQYLLGQPMYWSVPGLTFIVLVAVGADYNMLLISRIREESPAGVRGGVIRTVKSTGGVITAASVIFAATMFGLLFAEITTMVQAGFVMGVGLLLDAFLVRTITVPALAALIGRANWWPAKVGRAW